MQHIVQGPCILFAERSGVGRGGSARSCPQHTTLGQVLSTIRIDSSGPVHNIQRVVRSCPQHAMVRQEGVDLGEHLVRRKHRPRRLSQILQKRKCLLDPVHNMQRYVSSCSKHATLRQVVCTTRNDSLGGGRSWRASCSPRAAASAASAHPGPGLGGYATSISEC